ncbi:DUF721 domain-containing protein [bacterium]|nr:DUF721 domain-containing protein [bacterium]
MQPEPISSVIRRILFNKGLTTGIKEAEVVSSWEEIVGEKLAKNAEAYVMEKGILFLRVADSAWRNELSLMKEELIEKVNAYFGEQRISRIHLI